MWLTLKFSWILKTNKNQPQDSWNRKRFCVVFWRINPKFWKLWIQKIKIGYHPFLVGVPPTTPSPPLLPHPQCTSTHRFLASLFFPVFFFFLPDTKKEWTQINMVQRIIWYWISYFTDFWSLSAPPPLHPPPPPPALWQKNKKKKAICQTAAPVAE